MPGLFSRLKNWISLENLTNEDLNDEFNNIISNFTPDKMDDWSTSVSQMRTDTNPGIVGSESQATSMAGEVERLRYKLRELMGTSYWYETPAVSLSDVSSYINGLGALTGNRIVSGKLNADGTEIFLKPSGSTNAVTLKASSVDPFICYIDGVLYTFTSDITLSGLTQAPSTQNTATITNTDLNGSERTRVAGQSYVFTTVEFGNGSTKPAFQERQIELGSIGTNITALNNVPAVYMLTDSGTTEFIYGALFDSNKFTDMKRGMFFDSSDTAKSAMLIDTATTTVQLMKAAWIFLKSTGTLDVTYNKPVYSGTQPSSPSTGDYWYDIQNDTWKRYNGSAYVAASAVYVGLCATGTANTLAARSAEAFRFFSNENSVAFNLDADLSGLTTIYPRSNSQRVSVFGKTVSFDALGPKLNYTADKDGAFSPSTSRWYIVYVTNTGSLKWSDVNPIDRRGDGLGWTHPYKPWRAVAFLTAGASNFSGQLINISDHKNEYVHWLTIWGFGDTSTYAGYSSAATTETDITNATDFILRGRNKRMMWFLSPMFNYSTGSFVVYVRLVSTGIGGVNIYLVMNDAMSGSAYNKQAYEFFQSNMAVSDQVMSPISSLQYCFLLPERDYRVKMTFLNSNNSSSGIVEPNKIYLTEV